jgi:hypothetical protein
MRSRAAGGFEGTSKQQGIGNESNVLYGTATLRYRRLRRSGEQDSREPSRKRGSLLRTCYLKLEQGNGAVMSTVQGPRPPIEPLFCLRPRLTRRASCSRSSSCFHYLVSLSPPRTHAQLSVLHSTPSRPPQNSLQKMRLTVATEEGSTFNIDVDPDMELENVAALLEAEVRTELEKSVWVLYSSSASGERALTPLTSLRRASLPRISFCSLRASSSQGRKRRLL